MGIDVLVVGPYRSINPYCAELTEALDSHRSVGRLSYGPLPFWHGKGPFDVIHVHFPELLTRYRAPSAAHLTEVASRIAWWRSQGSIVAVTLHDWVSHNKPEPAFDQLYDVVFGAADLIIHLGTRSAVEAATSSWHPGARHVVIPHHLFASFGPPVRQERARLMLGLDEAASIVVVAQTLRSVAEVDLIDAARASADLVVVVGGTQAFDAGTADAVGEHLARLETRPGIWLHHRRSSDAELARFVSAADLTLVARTRPCNSGGVVLGTGLARVVVGPDVGNVGSSLHELGNPTFDPCDASSVVEGARVGLELAAAGHGSVTFRHAVTHWSVPRVADLHVRAYAEMIRGAGQTDEPAVRAGGNGRD